MPDKTGFKNCSTCGQMWFTREDLLYDPEVSLFGYQVHFLDRSLGLFYFNHQKDNCRTIFAVNVSEFLDLYNGPIYQENKMGDEDCPLYCLRRTDMRPCQLQCECAYVREIMQTIRTIHAEAEIKEALALA